MTASFDTYRITGVYRLAALRNVASVVTETQIPFTNGVAFKDKIKTITYEGDGQSLDKYVLEGMTMESKADEFGVAAIKTIFGKSEVTASLPADEAVRLYIGDDTDAQGVTVGMAAYCTAEKVSTGANVKLKICCPRGILSSPEMPDLQNRNKSGMSFKFSAVRTTTDIAGAALPGVPTEGIYAYVAELV